MDYEPGAVGVGSCLLVFHLMIRRGAKTRAALSARHLRVKTEVYLGRHDGREKNRIGRARSASLLPPSRRRQASLLVVTGFDPQAFERERVIADEPRDF